MKKSSAISFVVGSAVTGVICFSIWAGAAEAQVARQVNTGGYDASIPCASLEGSLQRVDTGTTNGSPLYAIHAFVLDAHCRGSAGAAEAQVARCAFLEGSLQRVATGTTNGWPLFDIHTFVLDAHCRGSAGAAEAQVAGQVNTGGYDASIPCASLEGSLQLIILSGTLAGFAARADTGTTNGSPLFDIHTFVLDAHCRGSALT